MNRYLIIALYIFALSFYSCSSASMEYRSAITKVRTEKDLNGGEEWGLKALKIDSMNAQVPYFIATEIYKKQQRWEEEINMLHKAININSEQLLERSFYVNDQKISTIGEAAKIELEYISGQLFNQAVDYLNNIPEDKKIDDEGSDKLNALYDLCLLANPKNHLFYISKFILFAEQNKKNECRNIINQGLSLMPNSPDLNAVMGEFVESPSEKEIYFKKAIKYATQDNIKQLVGWENSLVIAVYNQEKIDEAIALSNELIDKYPDDPNNYFNVGLFYYNLAQELQNNGVEPYNIIISDNYKKNELNNLILDCYNSFKEAKEYINTSIDFLLQASDLELEEQNDISSNLKNTRLFRKRLTDVYINSIREIARKQNIKL